MKDLNKDATLNVGPSYCASSSQLIHSIKAVAKIYVASFWANTLNSKETTIVSNSLSFENSRLFIYKHIERPNTNYITLAHFNIGSFFLNSAFSDSKPSARGQYTCCKQPVKLVALFSECQKIENQKFPITISRSEHVGNNQDSPVDSSFLFDWIIKPFNSNT